jgi:autophagy-related protein 18
MSSLQEDGAAGICEMLFSSSLVAIAGAGEPPSFSPRKLQIINTKRQTVVCELNFPTKVLAVLMNRKRLVVVLDTKLHIYDLSTMKIVHTIETAPNSTGK